MIASWSPFSTLAATAAPVFSSSALQAPLNAAANRSGLISGETFTTRRDLSTNTTSMAKRMKIVCTDVLGFARHLLQHLELGPVEVGDLNCIPQRGLPERCRMKVVQMVQVENMEAGPRGRMREHATPASY